MERISEEQVARLVAFVYARIPDTDSVPEDTRCAVAALRLVADRQIAAVRYSRASHSESAVVAELAAGSWNLLVSIACIWRDHPEFPADAAIETFEFDAENPLVPAT